MNTWALILLATSAVVFGAEDGIRGILPEDVVQARPRTNGPAVPKPGYQRIGPGSVETFRPAVAAGRQVGVTIWRLRAATTTDTGARILVQDDANTTEWIPERVSSTNGVRNGDRVRLTIECPETGYLYVIDRERYASGERGTPYLIFPTSRTRGGDNQVIAGKLVDIPGQEDRPNFFAVRPSRSDQVEEELTVLLTPQPIPALEIGPKATALTKEQVHEWERRWGSSKVDRFELAGGAGKAWTASEQQAAADASRVLTQEDPPPQTIYRVAANPGEPVLVKVRLQYRASPKPRGGL